MFALRLGEFLGTGHRDVFQQLVLLAGSTALDFDALVAKAGDPDFLAELAVTRDSYLKGLEFVKETAENLQAGGNVPATDPLLFDLGNAVARGLEVQPTFSTGPTSVITESVVPWRKVSK